MSPVPAANPSSGAAAALPSGHVDIELDGGRYRGPRPPVSVVILTFNEEANIAECIRSCSWSDDVHVLDSGSTDRTVEIARSMGVQVHANPFASFGAQRNWAIDNIPCKHRWCFHLDADERCTPQLVGEFASELGPDGAKSPHACYRCPSKVIFLGVWLKHAARYPAYQVRLFKLGACRFMDKGHSQREAEPKGSIGVLASPYMHYNFSKGLVDWLYRHNTYSDHEARDRSGLRALGRPPVAGLFQADREARRQAAQDLGLFLPLRAIIRFAYAFLFRLGFLDGLAGMHYCLMISMYEYWIELKLTELDEDWSADTNARVHRMLEASAAAVADPPDVTPAGILSPTSIPASTPERFPGYPTSRKLFEAGRGIDILIPTLNEANHIVEAVANARAVGDVYVLDSFSTDGTQDLARAGGASVFEHKFIDYATQKNWGLDNLPFKGRWVFILDADERITPELREEIFAIAAADGPVNGYYVNRVVIYMGSEVRHGGLYPSWNLRFFRRGKCRYEDRAVHEHMVCDGDSEYLRHEMLHIRRESLFEWIRKHIKYADLESQEWIKLKRGRAGGEKADRLFKGTLKFRQWIRREVWPRTPCRGFLRFVFMYFVRLGALDGRAGLRLAALTACYEYMIGLLYREKYVRNMERDRQA